MDANSPTGVLQAANQQSHRPGEASTKDKTETHRAMVHTQLKFLALSPTLFQTHPAQVRYRPGKYDLPPFSFSNENIFAAPIVV